ncbi:MAG: hypothetical protein ABI867_43475, partial [Kofleriaceae bacterium]
MKPDKTMTGSPMFNETRIIIRSLQHPEPLSGITGEFSMLVPVTDWHEQTAVIALLPALAKFPCKDCVLAGALAQATYDQLDPVISELDSSMSMMPSESLDDAGQMFALNPDSAPVIVALCAENAEATAALHRAAKTLGFRH